MKMNQNTQHIWFSSDTHFGHNRAFIYEPRGFSNIYEHDKTIINNWNSLVDNNDEVYLLGDIMLGDNEYGLNCLKQLKGRIHIVRGNHCTDARMELYKQCWNVIEITEGQYLKVNGQNFYLCHYPTNTSNLEKSDNLKEHIINLYGHTHQKTNFYQGIPYMYHVGVDSHSCIPVSLEQVLADIKQEIKKCKSYL